MTEVFLYKLPDISDGEFLKLLGLVSPKRQEKILRLKVKDKQRQSLFAKLVLRAVLCARLRVENFELSFATTERGKPYLTSHPDFYFSMSHTDGLVAVALSDGQVGIDAEKLKPADLRLCERFFSKSEQDYITMNENEADQCFFEVWTQREAYAKYTGLGLSLSFGRPIAKELCKTFSVDEYTVSVCCEGDTIIVPSEETESIINRFIG